MKKRWFALVLAAVMILLAFSGCGMKDDEFEQEGISLVIIVGNHANAHRYNDDVVTKDIHDLLVDAVTRSIDGSDYKVELNVSVIVSDGEPTREQIVKAIPVEQDEDDETAPQEYTYEPVELTDDGSYAEKAIREAEDIIEDVEDFLLLDSLRAEEAGNNLPAAISEAARILRNNPGKENHIFIYDTGVVTEGKMGMGSEEGLLDIQDGTPDEVLNRLNADFFPDLSGIHVHFYGLGDVCGDQIDMRTQNVSNFENNFVALWEKFFERCNVTPEMLNGDGSLVYADTGNNPMHSGDGGYPDVREVLFYEVIEKTDEGTGEVVQAAAPLPINLSANELGGFKGDSAEFRNEQQARDALLSYYEYALKEVEDHSELKLYIVGSRAKTEPDDDFTDHETSHDRAIAVSKLIQEMFDISADQIIEIDAGVQRFSWSSTAEEFPGGKWPSDAEREAAQSEHRVVTLIPATENNASRLDELSGEPDILP